MVERRVRPGSPAWKQRDDRLDAVFKALADPTRRAIVGLLERGEQTLSDLATPMPMSLPAVAKHVDVLERAGLVAHRRVGREKRHRLQPEPLSDAEAWIKRYGHFWTQQLNSLDTHLTGADQPHERKHRR